MNDEKAAQVGLLGSLMSVYFGLVYVGMSTFAPKGASILLVLAGVISTIGGMVLYIMSYVIDHKSPKWLYKGLGGEVKA